MSCILQAKNLKKYYGKEPNLTKALDGVSLDIEQGEFAAIVGTSGSGKSTLLNMLGGLDTPTSGSVSIRGKEIEHMNQTLVMITHNPEIALMADRMIRIEDGRIAGRTQPGKKLGGGEDAAK